MTIKDSIDIVDNIKPNQYTIKEKVMWLSFVDETIINDVLKTHEGYDGRYDDFEGYSEDRLSVPLIVPSPYDRLYTAYLKMKIDQENGETARYNNSATLYNTYLMEYRKYYNKTHLPLDVTGKRDRMPIKKATIGLSDAEYENLKRDLTFIMTEYFSNTVSHDKVYEVVNEFVQNNIHLFRVSSEEIKNAILQYLEKNPIEVTETDPTVPDWAKQPTKPTYSASDVGAYSTAEIGFIKDLGIGNDVVSAINELYKTKIDGTDYETAMVSKADKESTYTKDEVDALVESSGNGGSVNEIYIGTEEPTDPNVLIWINPDENTSTTTAEDGNEVEY